MRTPLVRLREIFGDAFRNKNVSCVRAIHYALGGVDSSARDIGAIIHIAHLVDRAAVNSHSQLNVWVALERLLNLNRALDRRFGSRKENERHSITSRKADQTSARFGRAKGRTIAHHVAQALLQSPLLIGQQFRITDDVHEQDVANLQFRSRLRDCRHDALSLSLPAQSSQIVAGRAMISWRRRSCARLTNAVSARIEL